MDIGELKNKADKSYDIATAKQNALEKTKSRLLMAYEQHLFLADDKTICTVKTLSETKKEFYMLDTNDNPCHIKDPENFLEKLIERNQEALNAYHQTFQKRI